MARSKSNPHLLLISIAEVLRHLGDLEFEIVSIGVVVSYPALERLPIGKARQEGRNQSLFEANRVVDYDRRIGLEVRRHPIVDVLAQAEQIVVVKHERQRDIIVIKFDPMSLKLAICLSRQPLFVGRDEEGPAGLVVADSVEELRVIVECRIRQA